MMQPRGPDIPAAVAEAIQILQESQIADKISDPVKSPDPSYAGWSEFSCVVCPQVPVDGNFPRRVTLKVLLHPTFPCGNIEIYPVSESIRYYAHQDGESGKLCLRPDYQAPRSVQRLVTYMVWAKEWLEDAAAGRLIGPEHPYELPDFRRKKNPSAPLVLFCEDSESFESWRPKLGSCGLLKHVTALDGKAFFIRSFLSEGHERKLQWGSLVPAEGEKAGIWILCSKELVLDRRRPALTWGELRSIFEGDKIDLRRVLLGYWNSVANETGRVVLLMGFPIPEKFGTEPIEIHWQPVFSDNWTRPSKNFAGQFRTPKTLVGFHLEHPEGIFRPGAPIPWGRSSNISPNRYFGRGPLPPHLQSSRIALIGCGTLGSAIAELMVRAGLRYISLFDGDSFVAGNFSRHQCGLDNLGQNKANSLAAVLINSSPHVQALPFDVSLPFGETDQQAERALSSADVWIDCSADEDVFTFLNGLAQSLGKKLIRVYVTWGAKYLCAVSGGPTIACGNVQDAIMAERERGTIPPDFYEEKMPEELLLEGPGCWHPTFPAPWYSIRFLASSLAAQIASLNLDQWLGGWGFVIKNPWVTERGQEQGPPLIWFREFQSTLQSR